MFGGLNILLWEADRATERQLQAKHVIQKSLKLLGIFFDASEALAQYGITKRATDLKKFEKYSREWPAEMQDIETRVGYSSEQAEIMERIKEEWTAAVQELNEIRDTLKESDTVGLSVATVMRRHRLKRYADRIRGNFKLLITRERLEEAASHSRRSQIRTFLNIALLGGCMINTVLALVLARFFTISITDRLCLMQANTENLSKGQSLNPPLRGSDEIAQLDHSFHEMAKKLEQVINEQKAISDNTIEAIVSLSPKLVVLNANPAVDKQWGHPVDALTDKSILNVAPESHKNELKEALLEVVNQKGQKRFDSKIQKAEGLVMETAWSCQWSEENHALYCVVNDITERKRLEQMQRDLIAMVSHDIRSPLTSIAASNATLLSGKAGELSSKAKAAIERAERSVTRMKDLVNDLLDMERLESADLTLEYRWTESNKIIEAAIATCDPGALDNAEIEKRAAAASFMADESKLIQVVTNLISNAIRHADGAVRIEIEVEKINDIIKFSVSDNGPGIAEENQAFIFDKFSRPAGSKTSGFGLGLAICRRIVQAHHGRIGLSSKLGQGSTFWFEIPSQPQNHT